MRRLLAPVLVTAFAISAAQATISVYLSPEELAAVSPLVVEGLVTRVASGRDAHTGHLATYVTIRVQTVHRGPDGLGEVVLREPGAVYDEWIHHVDAVPVYQVRERVLVFLEPARDGALRTTGMFFGKWLLPRKGGAQAVRDLTGGGTILRRGARGTSPSLVPRGSERLPVSSLLSVVVSTPLRENLWREGRLADAAPWSAHPPEWRRLEWGSTTKPRDALEPAFVPLSSASPVRWNDPDTGTPVVVQIQPTGNPLGDGPAAADEIRRAMAVWTNVPEARIALQVGSDTFDYTGTNASSPTAAYPPVNIVLFGDPYGDISDPSGCAGTLAIGGYWSTSSPLTVVNNVTFKPARRLYTIFNNGFECFLGTPTNLAEVATHELGHGLGFGHSPVNDAAMRAMAYGAGRGARLGSDDRDAAHCHYPHALALTAPNGGESWAAGTLHTVTWTASAEAGPDPGVVDIEMSTDGGATWALVSSAELNDGAFSWLVPPTPSAQARLRVLRPNLVSPTPAPYPSACSRDASNASFTIAAGGIAGRVAHGSLRLEPAGGGQITLGWGPSCSGAATEYAVYQGTLAALRAGWWDHVPLTCTAGTDLTETLTPGPGNRYYLVAARSGGNEGDLGTSSSGLPRPSGSSVCAPRESPSCP